MTILPGANPRPRKGADAGTTVSPEEGKMRAKARQWFSKLLTRPERLLALGFLVLILLGSVLLSLPVSARNGRGIGYFNGLFTATSAVCVTGLVAVDTATSFAPFGQAVLLVLIQVGGLGFMVFATLIMSMLGHRFSLKGRMLMRESMNASTTAGLVHLARVYGLMALGIELAGAALLSIRLVPAYGWGKGLWFSLFHAVSAFCNAGFDLFGNFSSLTSFAHDPLVLLTAAVLIILGGLGFSVILETVRCREGWRGLSLHARIVLVTTGALLLAGTLFFGALENGRTLTGSAGENALNAFFQSVTMRTAGFNSVDLSAMSDGSKFFSCLLMLVGASPASTGGGIKTTTIAALLLLVVSVVKGENEVNLSGRRLGAGIALRALAVTAIALGMLILGTLLITVFEGGRYPFVDILFETCSAVATVGVSSIGSPKLTLASKITLLPMMFLGRVGPMTLAAALAKRQSKAASNIKYPEEQIMIG